MKPAHRLLSALAVGLGLVLAPAASQGEAQLTTLAPATSGALDFRIVVPPVMRVLENSHPSQLTSGADGLLSGQQRLVVLSNMKRGFCVTLRLRSPDVDQWQVRAAPESGVTLQAAGQAYRLCSDRPGRYTMVLQHQFGPSAHVPGAGQDWPVQTDITTL
ncbi:hypothetical protein [Hydrogenophaga sp. NH-16]|uniref:hypothetical protein n=1 Tax=Hydrogenophaga sp. NH-16 TaxID=2184519 RepID=UPI000FD87D26|nr:hypothetical protein [Hydrogenophaga sp. NH-16]